MIDTDIKPVLCVIITVSLILILGATWCINSETDYSSEWFTTVAYIDEYIQAPYVPGELPHENIFDNGANVVLTYSVNGKQYTNSLIANNITTEYTPGTAIYIMYKDNNPNVIKEYTGMGTEIIGYICSIIGSIILAFAGCIAYSSSY